MKRGQARTLLHMKEFSFSADLIMAIFPKRSLFHTWNQLEKSVKLPYRRTICSTSPESFIEYY